MKSRVTKITLIAILLLSCVVTGVADDGSDKDLIDKIWQFGGFWGIQYEGDGILSSTLTYSGVKSPDRSYEQGSRVTISGTVNISSATGTWYAHFKSISFEIWKNGTSYWNAQPLASRKYSISGEKTEIKIEDYSSEIIQDIASLPLGNYNYQLSLTYIDKLGEVGSEKRERIADTDFSITNDGKSYKKPSVSISGTSTINAIVQGSGFSVNGIIETNYGEIETVTVMLDNRIIREYHPHQKTFNLGNNVGSLSEAKTLSEGYHSFSVSANAVNGYEKSGDKTLIEYSFTVTPSYSVPNNPPSTSKSSTSTENTPVKSEPLYSDWSSWSSWSTEKQEATDTKQVESKSSYKWWAAQCTTCGTNNPYHGSKSKCHYCGTTLANDKGLWKSVFVYTDDTSKATQTIYGRSKANTFDGQPYWLTSDTVTLYRYRTRTRQQ